MALGAAKEAALANLMGGRALEYPTCQSLAALISPSCSSISALNDSWLDAVFSGVMLEEPAPHCRRGLRIILCWAGS